METGSGLGSELTAGELPVNLTLDFEHERLFRPPAAKVDLSGPEKSRLDRKSRSRTRFSSHSRPLASDRPTCWASGAREGRTVATRSGRAFRLKHKPLNSKPC